jgi:hypothetical protein
MFVQRFVPLAAALLLVSACTSPVLTSSDVSAPGARATAGASGAQPTQDSSAVTSTAPDGGGATGVQAASGLMFGSGT